jgi:hypothetical protein
MKLWRRFPLLAHNWARGNPIVDWLPCQATALNPIGANGLGVITYSRGIITALDRPRLESLSCEC